MKRRAFCGSLAGLLPTAGLAAPLADVLERPAAPVRLSSKPVMLRITRTGERLVAVGERGLVLVSDDQGASWRQARVPVSVTLTGVQFVSPLQGFAIGHAAVVLGTQDGGNTWARLHDGRALGTDGAANPLLDLSFGDADNGIAVGAYGLALVTRDGGRSWQDTSATLPNPKGLHLYALARQGGQVFIAGEQGLFIGLVGNSPDGAAALNTPYRGSFFVARLLPSGELLLAGLRGTVLLRDAAGEFRAADSGGTQAIVSATLLPGGNVALVDQSGRVLLGNADHSRFTAQPLDAERRWAAMLPARDGNLVGVHSAGVGHFRVRA